MQILRLAAVSLILSFAVAAHAQEGGAILLSALSGTVEIQEGPDQPWKPASAGAELREGSSIRTGPDGRAQVTFPDKAVVWVRESSSFGLQSALPMARKVQVAAGEIKARIPHLKRKQSFEVHTANAVAAVRGTEFAVKTTPDGRLDIRVAYGEVRLNLLAEARTLTVPQGATYQQEAGVEGQLRMMNKGEEREVLVDWSPGLSEDQRNAALEAHEANRSSVEDFARQADQQQQAIDNLISQLKEEDFAAGRTLVDVHGNLTRVDQRLLRPHPDSIQFINLVKRPSYDYKDHGPPKPWTDTQGHVDNRLDSLQAFIKLDRSLPQDLTEWPSFFRDNDVKMVSADMVMTNQSNPSNILVLGSFADNCLFADTPACRRELKTGQDEIVGDFYVGSVNSIADIRDKTKLLRATELDLAGFQDYNVDGEANGTLFAHHATGHCIPDCNTEGHVNFWLTSEAYVIDNFGNIKNVNDFTSSSKDPFTLLKETAGQLIFSLKATPDNAELSNPGGLSPNIGGDLFLTKTNDFGNPVTVDARNKNIDLVITPDLAISIAQKLASSLSDAAGR